MLGLVAAAGLLWSVYQYLFVVYAGKTLGHDGGQDSSAHLQRKDRLTLRQRRHRVLSFYLSALSLGMGLMWVFVDVDGLCWHDRLSRTYLADRQPDPYDPCATDNTGSNSVNFKFMYRRVRSP